MTNNRKARFLNKELNLLNRNEQDYIEDLTHSLLVVQNSAGIDMEKQRKKNLVTISGRKEK